MANLEQPDTKRIAKILGLLQWYWKDNPHLRLGQLLSNAADWAGKDVFYIEDDELFEAIKKLW